MARKELVASYWSEPPELVTEAECNAPELPKDDPPPTVRQPISDRQKGYITGLRNRATAAGLTELAAEQVRGREEASAYIGRLLEALKAAEASGQVATATVVTTERRTESRIGAPNRMEQLQRTIDTAAGGMSMLIYDIPSSKNEECPNPSHMLWHFGFRLNLSCWVLPDKGLAARSVQLLLKHWQQHSIEVHIIPYHPDALEQIRSIARDKLRAEVIRQHESLINRLLAAKERYDAAVAEVEDARQTERLSSINDAAIRSILKTAAEQLNAAVSCAEHFDETESVKALLDGLRGAISAEKTAFNALMKAKGGKQVA